MVNFPLREDDQRIWAARDDLYRRAKRPQIMTFAIDTEAAVALEGPATHRAEELKNLPGDHEAERPLQFIRCREQNERVGVPRMVGGDENAVTLRHGATEVF